MTHYSGPKLKNISVFRPTWALAVFLDFQQVNGVANMRDPPVNYGPKLSLCSFDWDQVIYLWVRSSERFYSAFVLKVGYFHLYLIRTLRDPVTFLELVAFSIARFCLWIIIRFFGRMIYTSRLLFGLYVIFSRLRCASIFVMNDFR